MKSRNVIVLCALLCTGSSFGASGIFGTGVLFNVNGTDTLYTTTLPGDGRHAPAGSSPTIITGLPSDLGTFDTGIGNTLSLKGGGVLSFKNSGDDITGANIFYSINGGSFSSLTLAFNEDNVNGNSGDQRWYGDSGSIDLTGLGNGVHTLDVFYNAPFTFTGGGGGSGTHTENNSNANFSTSFTVVPEPTSAALGLLGACLLLRRRRI